MRRHVPGGAICPLLLVAASACVEPTLPPLPVAGCVVTPATLGVLVGDSIRLRATAQDAEQAEVRGVAVTFTSTAPTVAQVVAATGLVTGVAPGVAEVAATCGSGGGTAVGRATVSVAARPAASVVLQPAMASLFEADTVAIRATVRDDRGGTVVAPRLAWSSLSATVARVDSTGRVEALAPGTALIRASVDGAQATATISVAARVPATLTLPPSYQVEAGEAVTAQAVVRDVTGRVLPGRLPTWSSSAPTIATVDAAGIVRGVAPGTAVITARLDALSASTTVTVIPGAPVARVDVTPASASVIAGRTLPFTATPRDATNRALNGRVVTWRSADVGVATVSASGVATGLSPGATAITAVVDGRQGTALLAVTPVPVASVTISPAAPAVRIGQTVALTATVRDSSGTPITGRSVTWTSLAPATATVNGTGVVTGVAEGSASIRAQVDGVQGTATVQVTAPPVSRVEITPSSPVVPIGGMVALTATAFDSAGSVMAGRSFSWATTNSTIAAVSATGVVTGVAGGNASISATTGGRTAQVSVSVRAIGAVTRVEVTPGRAYLLRGESRTLLATAYDGNGFVVTGRPVTWSGSDATIATVASDGTVRAVALGTMRVTAQVDGRSATVEVRIVPTYGQAAARVHAASASTGGWVTCAVTPSGEAFCWGENWDGQVGDGTQTSREQPVPVAGGISFREVQVGSRHTCGISIAGAAFCWGDNSFAALGDGTTITRLTPTAVQGGRTYKALAVARTHTCAVDTDGQAWCWGSNNAGQLGVGSSVASSSIPRAVATPARFESLLAHVTGGFNEIVTTCGITATGALWCWGNGLPDGINQTRYTPVNVSPPVSVRNVIGLPGGPYCVLDMNGEIWCTTFFPFGWQRRPGFTATALLSYYTSPCALNTSGTVRCWAQESWSGVLQDQPPLVAAHAYYRRFLGIDAAGRIWQWSSDTAPPDLVVIPP
jgi:uncharacterized protein YjdB